MQTTTKTTARRIALLSALPLVGALALAGCAGDDDRDDTAAPAASAPSVTATDGGASGSTGSGRTGSGSDAAGNDALGAAAETAREAVGSGTVTSIEQEAGGTSWEVLVVTADGNEQEVHVAADGERTTAGPTEDSTDAEDVADNQRFVDAADLSVEQAASTLVETVPGTVTELGLDDHAGTVVWEGDVRDDAGTKHSIRIDAGSGEVVTNTVDTDD
ncbi:PepSY domain-containing protein [Curtobacterium sp. ODYSSEY 48 V2]|uniref:PepSY domain-containing protein n=1 Tax=Curtobacterium sp. ODYSSEY 48 V2 TaxID=2939561 RepID=UPI00203CF991|nr:PepSY domain-containing protein [Curtobacterium sp. ODYSSEY 48 V2]MCM3505492.1 PepSY domain-containing protein [Curtobacterium sp. ODYSSEY 48 V2]